jgi:hypothetical protein
VYFWKAHRKCLNGKIFITVKITYDGLTNEEHEAIYDDTKPIIIHDYTFTHDQFRLQRRCLDYDPLKNSDEDPTQWKTYFDDEDNPGWRIVDEPDVEVNVTDSRFFRSLKPGETFVRKKTLDFLDLSSRHSGRRHISIPVLGWLR